MDVAPWKRSLTGTSIVMVSQVFVYYVRFMATDRVAPSETLIKTFLLVPFLLFAVGWATQAAVDAACCASKLEATARLVAFSGVTRALLLTWATVPAEAFVGQNPLLALAAAAAAFVISLGVFLVLSYPSILLLRQEQLDADSASTIKN